MPIALLSDVFPGRPPAETAAAVAAAGFGAVELNACRRSRPHLDCRTPEVERLAGEWRQACDSHGLSVAAVAAFENLAALDGAARRAAVGYCRRALATFGTLGCRRLTLMVSGSNLLPVPSQWIALRASLDELAAAAAAQETSIALEIYPGNFLECTADVLDFLAALDAPHVGYLLCVAHLAAIGEDVVAAYRQARGRLSHVHLSDTPTGTPLHRHLAPGLGQADWRGICRLLGDDDFAGPLTIQLYSHSEDEAPVELARQSLQAVRAALAGND
jgi:sugar phosphate isomerase/epimerase